MRAMSPTTFASTAIAPHERGVEFGRAHRDEIARTTARYRALFVRRGPAGFDATPWARRFREAIGDLHPASLAEMAGIAEGAGVDQLDVVAVNARTEILAKADPRGERECSTVAVVPPTGSPFGAQTWDWYTAMADGWLRWTYPTSKTRVDAVTEFGLLGKIGRNDAGLGVFLNILHHEADENDGAGVPVHLLARLMLEQCAGVAEAIALARRTPVVASTALTVLDRTTVAGLELFSGGPGLLAPDAAGVLVRTNHFLSSEGAAGCLTAADYPSTHLRLERLVTTLHADPPTGTADIVAAMVHHHPDGGVCRHGEPELPAELRSATLATVTIDADGLTVRAGGPCGAGPDEEPISAALSIPAARG